MFEWIWMFQLSSYVENSPCLSMSWNIWNHEFAKSSQDGTRSSDLTGDASCNGLKFGEQRISCTLRRGKWLGGWNRACFFAATLYWNCTRTYIYICIYIYMYIYNFDSYDKCVLQGKMIHGLLQWGMPEACFLASWICPASSVLPFCSSLLVFFPFISS